MDIEQTEQKKSTTNECENHKNQTQHNTNHPRQQFQNEQGQNNRNSFQGRISNQSYMSFGRMSVQEPVFYENQKISLQSNISSKARQKYEKGDLFQNLANQGRNYFHQELFVREEGSFGQYDVGNQPGQNVNVTQVHYPVFNNLGLENSSNFLSSFNPHISHQFKQRSSEGTNNISSSTQNQSFHNQSESIIKTKNYDNKFQSENKTSKFHQTVQQIKEPEQKVISCKCPRSKCLLMYCQCFSKGIMCNPSCSCYQCRNNPDFEEKRQNARRIVLERDPNAFSNKLQVVGGEESSDLAYKRGCNCKKTNCFKKYCECFYAGVKCTYLCKCQNCMNGGENAYKG